MIFKTRWKLVYLKSNCNFVNVRYFLQIWENIKTFKLQQTYAEIMGMLLICYQGTINKLGWIFNKSSKGSAIGV